MADPSGADVVGEDFASAPMVALVLHQLRARAPELIPAGLDRIDPIRQARSSLALKRDLLGKVHARVGSRFVFEMGRGLRELGLNPILQAFLRSRDGDVLLAKWRRYERYGHARHRTRMEPIGPGHFELHHYAMTGPAPGPAHDLLILGVMVALLDAVGAPELAASLEPGGRALVRDGEIVAAREEDYAGPTDRWTLRWRAGPGDVEEARPPASTAAPGRMAERIHALLGEDPARTWSLAAVARALGTSSRSLQRRLAGEGTSFSELVRAVRVGEACRLLESADASLTEIGYLCGFSDAAHFSRDFRASTGASPSDFRQVVKGPAER